MATGARTAAPQIVSNPVAGMQDGNNTSMSAALYTNLYLGSFYMGGIRSWHVQELAASTPQNQGGNDRLEAVPGMRYHTFSIVRNPIRGRQVRDMMARIYKTVADIDFRKLPVDIRIHQIFLSASGHQQFENRWRTIRTGFITQCDDGEDDPNALQSETISGWAMAQQHSGDSVQSLGPHSYLLGNAGDLSKFSQVAPIAKAF